MVVEVVAADRIKMLEERKGGPSKQLLEIKGIRCIHSMVLMI
jgi:hypothetical protein